MTTNKINLKEVKTYIDNNEYIKVKIFFDENSYANINDKMKNGFISLKIRYLIYINNIEEMFKIIKDYKLMKRDYILLVIYFYNIDNDISLNIFNNYVIKNHKLEYTDIDKLLENKCYNIIQMLDNYFVHCSMKENIHQSDYDIFYKYDINMIIKQKLFEFYKDKLKDKYFNSIISKIHDIDCIVDGGNISHVNGGKCDYKYVSKISQMIADKYKNPLYIFHNRHKKNLKDFLKTVNHFITPVHDYDDYYIILAMVLSDKPIVTNDCFRDHIFDMFKNFDTIDFKIKNYIHEHIINYTKNSIGQEIKYSKCIQIIDNNIYIPTHDGMYKVLI
tara:strand:+ start:109 stop:1104 length:996 start_codon:yes stop_codon:yes gene_type:complete